MYLLLRFVVRRLLTVKPTAHSRQQEIAMSQVFVANAMADSKKGGE